MIKIFFIVFISFVFFGCIQGSNGEPINLLGYVPVYETVGAITNIGMESAKGIEKPGKIYVIGNLLLQNDVNKGVHFIDISNPAQPRKLAFLRVPWSTELSVKNNHLYINNYNDLLVFNITDVQNPLLIKRLQNVFPYHNSEYPRANNVYFECVDKSKGIVVDWKLQTIASPKCRR